MLKNLVVLILFSLIACCLGRTSEDLKVQLPDGGKLVGRYLTSDSGRGIRAFMGVPYAEPPIGELRFKVSLNNNDLTILLTSNNRCNFEVSL